jgi:tetratricopeptide (TPR) repeat protein
MSAQPPSRAVRWGATVLAACLAGMLFWAVFFGGGSGSDAVPVLGSVVVAGAAAALAAGMLGTLALPRLDRPGLVGLAGVVALVALGGLSVVWSIAGDRSWLALAKGLVYLAALVLGLVAGSTLAPRATRTMAAIVAAVLGLALAWALIGRAVPGLFPDGGRIARLRNPVGYWNGLALLADASIALGLWLSAVVRVRGARSGGALLVYAAVLVVLLAQSRSGLIAGAVVLALWLVLTERRLEGGLLAVIGGAPALALGAWVFTRPALVEDGADRAERVTDGRWFAALAVLAAVVVVALARAVPVERLAAERARQLARGLAVSAAAVVVAGVVGLVAAVGNPVRWADEQLAGRECVNAPGRLVELCDNNRRAWWNDAWDVFVDHPAGGTGALTYEIARKRVRRDATPVLQPHSVPLQFLADTGLVGLALALLAVAALAAGAVAAIRRLRGPERDAAVALVALPAAYAVHALVDYPLDFIAVTVPTLVALGALLAAGRPVAPRPAGRSAVRVGAVVAGAVAVIAVLVTPSLAGRDVDRAYRLLNAGRLEEAADAADRARALDPLSLDPVIAAALVAEARGEDELASALYRRATEMQPENPSSWTALGLYEFLARQDMCQAYGALNNAYTLDPNGQQWEPGGPLDVARAAVDAGACEPENKASGGGDPPSG